MYQIQNKSDISLKRKRKIKKVKIPWKKKEPNVNNIKKNNNIKKASKKNARYNREKRLTKKFG